MKKIVVMAVALVCSVREGGVQSENVRFYVSGVRSGEIGIVFEGWQKGE